MHSGMINHILKLCEQNNKMFDCFDDIYVFGSILNCECAPNDLDVLLVYSVFQNVIISKLEQIRFLFRDEMGLIVDLVVLSKEELKEVNFLERLNLKYVKVR